VGVSSYLSGGALNFWSRNYYVKIRADDENDAVNALLKKMAAYVAGKIGDPGKTPEEMSLFPASHRTKEKYAGNLLGMSFLKGFTCNYEKDDAELTLYLFHCKNAKQAEEKERLFVQKLKSPPKPAEDGKGMVFEDRYLGLGRIFRVGSYLTLVQGLPKAEDASRAWKSELIGAFIEGVTKAAMGEQENEALKALQFLGSGTDEKK
jgi:hypothetical protein